MITIEKDAKAEEIFIHATPEYLRGFAKTLWIISEKAEMTGKHEEQFTEKDDSLVELLTQSHRQDDEKRVIKKLTISCDDK